MNTNHKLMSFRLQRSLFAMIVFGLIGAYTLSVQWSHVDQINGLSQTYATMFRVGLASAEVIIFMLLVWELFAKDHSLTLACFGTIILLEIVCVMHAGAILQLDSNRALVRQVNTDSVDAQIRLATEMEKARIAATADAAAKLNSIGQTRTANRVARAVGATSSAPAVALPGPAESRPVSSFLPDWYLNGAQYFVTILLAYLGFAFCFFVSRSSLATEDEPAAAPQSATSGNPGPVAPPVATSMATSRPVGFAINTNLQPASTATMPEPADPKVPPRTTPGA